jgi:putative transposase
LRRHRTVPSSASRRAVAWQVSRQRRLLFPGAVYHVTARGNERQSIFRSRLDRERFLELLAETITRFAWICHGYCELGNHYHLEIETPRPNLPEGMRHLNARYAQEFNLRRQRVGHLLQGRYGAVLVQKDGHLLEMIRYVALNPVRAGLAERAEEWRWSSYPAMLGLAPRPAWLTCDWVLGQFGNDVATARRRLKTFVDDGRALAGPPIRGGLFLGDDDFVRAAGGDPARIEEVPRAQWQPIRPTLAELFATDREALVTAHRTWGYTFREIGELAGRHSSTISRRYRRRAAELGG